MDIRNFSNNSSQANRLFSINEDRLENESEINDDAPEFGVYSNNNHKSSKRGY